MGEDDSGDGERPLILTRSADGAWNRVTTVPDVLGGSALFDIQVGGNGRVVLAVGVDRSSRAVKPLVLARVADGVWVRDENLPGDVTSGRLFSAYVDADGRTLHAAGEVEREGTRPLLLATRDLSGAVGNLDPDGFALYLKDEAPRWVRSSYLDRYTALQRDISAAQQSRASIERRFAALEQEQQKPDANEMLAVTYETLLTRVTTLVITFFLVQLMVGLYKYNYRLAGYYDARADALLLAPHYASLQNKPPIQDLFTSLSPDVVDFGRSPKGLTEQATELAKAMFSKAGK